MSLWLVGRSRCRIVMIWSAESSEIHRLQIFAAAILAESQDFPSICNCDRDPGRKYRRRTLGISADQLNSIRVITQITCAWFVHLYVQRICSAAQSATNTPSTSKRSKDVACAKAATAWFRIQRCVGRRCLRDRALMITVERWLGMIRHNSLFS